MKMLYFLNSEKRLNRVARRAIVVGLLSAVAVLANAFLDVAPIYVIPVLTGLLAAIDRSLRK